MHSLVTACLGLAAGMFAFSAGVGLTGSWPVAAAIGAAGAGLASWWAHRYLSTWLDEAACSRGLKILSGVAAVAALILLARLTVFTVAPSLAGYSVIPSSKWEVRHSCVSAYFVAAKAAGPLPNVYADSLYTAPDDNSKAIRKARTIGPFNIDVYEYPPPFLLLPRTLAILTPDFLRFRMLWFGLGGGLILLAMVVVARMLGPAAGTRALLFSPLVWAAIPTLSTLQKGNAQGVVIVASMLAMALFERRRWAAGGAILAFVTLSKLYPGLLIVYLLGRRDWRAVAWTAVMSVVFLAWSVLDTGWAPYAAFRHHFPGLLGGEAFPAFRNPAATAINFSIPGLVFKLKLFGVPGMGFGAAKVVGWFYTPIVAAVTVVAARRAPRDGERPLVWLAILILATLRSPFLPQAYAAFPPLWLLTLLAATYPPNGRTLVMTLLGWAALNVFWPLDWPIDPRVLATANLVPQGVTIALAVLALRRRLDLDAESAVRPIRQAA